jgi:hypothetical protein
MSQSIEERQKLLKKALMGNGVFSIVSGIAILLANRWLVHFMGLPENVNLGILGISLIVYSVLLWLNARRPKVKITDAWIAVFMDTVWVVGSYVLLFAVPFSVGGKWLVALVAEMVLVFAIWQWLGIRRVKQGPQPA